MAFAFAALYSPLLQNAIKMVGRNFVCQGEGGKRTDAR